MSPSNSDFPNSEQKDVLDSTARITVVRACPGSGKTRVFVESMRRHLNSWQKKELGSQRFLSQMLRKNRLQRA